MGYTGDCDELHEVDKLYPVISTIPSGTGWEVQVVADEDRDMMRNPIRLIWNMPMSIIWKTS